MLNCVVLSDKWKFYMFYIPLDESLKNVDTAASTNLDKAAPTNCIDTPHVTSTSNTLENIPKKAELQLLDLFSGCGGMSTGLCLGAKLSSVDLISVGYLMVTFYILGS